MQIVKVNNLLSQVERRDQQDVFYEISVATDVTKAWRRYGWSPPSEDPEIQAKWAKAKKPAPINGAVEKE